MQTIIPISVEEADTETLAKITELIAGKYNCTMQINLYQGRDWGLSEGANNASPITREIEEIFNLLGKSGQPHFIISMQPNSPS